jgi:hypothetical protein
MFVQLLPQEMVEKIRNWDQLKRWERREIGQTLRKMGLRYREIAAVIPVTKGTLSNWCRDIPVPEARQRELLGKRGGRARLGATLRQRAIDRAAGIREQARREAVVLVTDPFWVAGVSLYWAEGAKRQNEIQFSNSDPALMALFISWVEEYLDVDRTELTMKLHLHSGQDETERKMYWSAETGIPLGNFRKTYIKPEGTGHRKNLLYNGTASVRVPRSSADLHRMLGWIDALGETYRNLG